MPPQPEREAVLPPSVRARLAVEMGVAQRFGASAPANVLLREYGFSVEEVCQQAVVAVRAQGASERSNDVD